VPSSRVQKQKVRLKQSLITNLLILFITFVLLSLAAEGMVRWLYKDEMILFPMNQTPVQYGDYTIRQLRPNTSFWNTSMDGRWKYAVNAQGFREYEDIGYTKPSGQVRILSIGDSQTQGIEVRQEQTYSEVIERFLNTHGDTNKTYQVINAGISSFGTEEELVFLENEGIKYNPDVVILGFYANDLSDSSASNLFKVENGELAVNATYYVPGPGLAYKLNRLSLFRWLSEHSYLYSFVTKNVSASITQMRTHEGETTQATAVSIETNTQYAPSLLERERLLIERMYKFCQDNDVKLIILDMPDILSYELDQAEQYSRDFQTSIPEGLLQTMTDHSDYLLNSEDILAKYRGVAELHIPHGQRHLTEFGHLIYGMKIAGVIKALVH
jgi:lysophospholipase L1-like esterase